MSFYSLTFVLLVAAVSPQLWAAESKDSPGYTQHNYCRWFFRKCAGFPDGVKGDDKTEDVMGILRYEVEPLRAKIEEKYGPHAPGVTPQEREIAKLSDLYRRALAAAQKHKDASAFASDSDPEIRVMAEEEAKAVTQEVVELRPQIRDALIRYLERKNPNPNSVILEIENASGANANSDMVAGLAQMYGNLAKGKKWQFNVLSQETGSGDRASRITVEVTGEDAWQSLRHESGRHKLFFRSNEAGAKKGEHRMNVASVAVYPTPPERDMVLNQNDVKVETFAGSSGPGGQNVNKVATAVRLTHEPTGITVNMRDERTQSDNKRKAMQVLRARVADYQRTQSVQDRQAAKQSGGVAVSRSESPVVRSYDLLSNLVTDPRTKQKVNVKATSALSDVDVSLFEDQLQDHHLLQLLRQ